ncbi:MAG: GxxExxY protein [Bacteroidetes bacterium]|nr:MAG: GxxExxY protein [Bacteroidota bacterium]
MKSFTNYKHTEITNKMLQAFYKVYNTLGYGFLEKVYENALFFELCSLGFHVERQKEIDVYYEKKLVGKYFADLVIDHCVIVELKASDKLREENEYQLVNYLKATSFEVGLLLNFGKKPQVKRKVFSNHK